MHRGACHTKAGLRKHSYLKCALESATGSKNTSIFKDISTTLQKEEIFGDFVRKDLPVWHVQAASELKVVLHCCGLLRF